MVWSLKQLTGRTIEAIDGEVGRVEDVYFDAENWRVCYVVADTGGWMHGHKLLIPQRALVRASGSHDPSLRVRLDGEGLKQIAAERKGRRPASEAKKPKPPKSSKPVWARLPGTSELTVYKRIEGPPVDPHLRSLEEVIGYDFVTQDGKIGSVADVTATEDAWKLRHVVVQTEDPDREKQTLVPIHWIERAEWGESVLGVSLNRARNESIGKPVGDVEPEGVLYYYERPKAPENR